MRYSQKNIFKFTIYIILLLLCGFITKSVKAHDTSTAYIDMQLESSKLTGQLKIDLRDLQRITNLDSNHNGELTWGELRSMQPVMTSILSEHLLFSSENQCTTQYKNVLIESILDKNYAVFPFSASCPELHNTFQINYDLMFGINQRHKALIKLTSNTEQYVSVLDRDNNTKTFNIHETSTGLTFIEFIIQGVWHIWIGIDHILFLLSLLLAAIMQREKGEWQAKANWQTSTLSVFKIVTAFTMAHSITLALAGLQLITLPPMLIETAIAASVVIAALNNVKPFLPFGRVYIAFLFGLIHGFGFANVLTELYLQQANYITGLLGFNIGVELGQLAIVVLFMPIGLSLSRLRVYSRVILPFGSLAIAFMGILWVAERGFGIQVLPA
jgi:hypothetical protein